MDPDSKRLRVSVTDGRGRPVRDGGLSRWLESIAPARAHGELAIALVPDRHIQALNRDYRRKDRPTDVLSFPPLRPDYALRASSRSRRSASREGGQGSGGQAASRAPRPDPSTNAKSHIGDIVIARGVARRQAREAGHSEQTEFRVLALHGLLHLLGYDHHRSTDGDRMVRTEARLRRKGGLRAGLIERARASGTSRRNHR